MIDDIEFAGISEELKEKMIDKLGYDTVLNMACNYKRVKENIAFLKHIGINDIEEILLYNADIFLKKTEELQKKIINLNLKEVAKLINEDYTTVDDIFL